MESKSILKAPLVSLLAFHHCLIVVKYSFQRVLDAVAGDHLILTDPADNKNRRTLVMERGENEKFGFTIQASFSASLTWAVPWFPFQHTRIQVRFE